MTRPTETETETTNETVRVAGWAHGCDGGVLAAAEIGAPMRRGYWLPAGLPEGCEGCQVVLWAAEVPKAVGEALQAWAWGEVPASAEARAYALGDGYEAADLLRREALGDVAVKVVS